jgi:hypothetical protein
MSEDRGEVPRGVREAAALLAACLVDDDALALVQRLLAEIRAERLAWRAEAAARERELMAWRRRNAAALHAEPEA